MCAQLKSAMQDCLTFAIAGPTVDLSLLLGRAELTDPQGGKGPKLPHFSRE